MTKMLLVLFVLALVPVCALAVDGVVLINQSTVMAAGGFPYVISAAGSYKLSGNLTVTAIKDAIVIGHDDVSLDLNGFAVIGPGTFLSVGAAGCTPGGSPNHCAGINAIGGHQNTTIKNDVIRGFADGVFLLGSALISDVQTSKNLVGIAAIGSPSAIVVRCTANNNDLWGMSAVNLTVSESTASGNGGDGFFTGGSTLLHNVAMANAGYGINAGSPAISAMPAVVGSNTLLNNKTGDLNLQSGSISQNNNVCTAGAC